MWPFWLPRPRAVLHKLWMNDSIEYSVRYRYTGCYVLLCWATTRVGNYNEQSFLGGMWCVFGAMCPLPCMGCHAWWRVCSEIVRLVGVASTKDDLHRDEGQRSESNCRCRRCVSTDEVQRRISPALHRDTPNASTTLHALRWYCETRFMMLSPLSTFPVYVRSIKYRQYTCSFRP